MIQLLMCSCLVPQEVSSLIRDMRLAGMTQCVAHACVLHPSQVEAEGQEEQPGASHNVCYYTSL